MDLRPYQSDCAAAVFRSFADFTKVLTVIPTGGGKTIIFSHIASRIWKEKQKRTLIIAHREELLQQAKEKLERSTGIVAEIERADSHASLNAPVVIASIQTLMRRFDNWPANHFAIVIVDEAHHIMADSYQGAIQHFIAGGAKVLGVTATPGTKGKKALGNFFEDIAFEIGLLDLMKAGFLSRIVVKSFPLQADIPLVMKGSDYDQDAVDCALAPYLDNIAQRFGREIGNRKTIVFVPLVKTAVKFAELLRLHGVTADYICGESEDRKGILARHGAEFQVLVNSMLLTEGYDDPQISAMMILRPTRSEILFSQMVGRGTRVYCPWGCPSGCQHAARKRELLLLDPLWLHEDMKLVRPASLVTGRDDDRRSIAERVADSQEELLDLLDMKADAEHERETALAEKLAAQQKRRSKTVSIEEWAVLSHNPDIADYEPTMAWHEKPVSDKQRELLLKFGIDPDSISGRGQAVVIIDSAFDRIKRKLASFKQVRLLKQMGHPSPELATMAEASAFIDAHKNYKTTTP